MRISPGLLTFSTCRCPCRERRISRPGAGNGRKIVAAARVTSSTISCSLKWDSRASTARVGSVDMRSENSLRSLSGSLQSQPGSAPRSSSISEAVRPALAARVWTAPQYLQP